MDPLTISAILAGVGGLGSMAASLFSDNDNFLKIPSTKEQDIARAFMMSLMGKKADYPMLEVPGMSPAEEAGQALLGQFIQGSTFQDPSTSPAWRGYQDALREQEDRSVAALRHRQSLGGALHSSKGYEGEEDLRRGFGRDAAQVLGSLWEKERERHSPERRLSAAFQFGSVPRKIESTRAAAEYEKRLQDLLHPYRYQFPIAGKILDELRYVYQAPGPGMMSQFGSAAGGMGSLLSGLSDVF